MISGVLDQASARFHQPLLQARQRPILNPLRRRQPPPQIPQVVNQQAQCQPDLARAEPMASEPRHLHRLLAFLDPLLRRPSLVVEAHYRPRQQLRDVPFQAVVGWSISSQSLKCRRQFRELSGFDRVAAKRALIWRCAQRRYLRMAIDAREYRGIFKDRTCSCPRPSRP